MRFYNALRLAAQALLFPQRCVLCEKWVLQDDFSPLCTPCLENLESFALPLCQQCGTLLPGNFDDRHATCARCREHRFQFDYARASGPYQGRLRDLIRLYKFDGHRRLAGPLGRRLIETFRAVEISFEPDWIVPVPLHRRRQLERGFDQTLLLAELLSGELSVPVFSGIRRVRDTKPQFGLDMDERRRNLKNAFALQRDDWKSGSSLLIVDDVMTTGTTVDELSRCFRTEKADVQILVLTIARVPVLGYWA